MIPVCEPVLDGNEREYVNRCLDTGWISSGGEFIDRFEQEFATYCGCRYGIATTSGTTALHLALKTLGAGQGHEVIIPDFTIASCAFAVLYTGAVPVFVDCDPETFNIDTDKIEEAVTPKTKAIMPVHLYGRPCDMQPIQRLALKYKLFIIEDVAEAHGAEYKGKKVGGLGHIGCFSFFGNKIITSGEGGMLTTDSKEYAEYAKSLRNLAHSPSKRFLHTDVGFNYRMTNIEAAIGAAQLENIERHITSRLAHAELYNQLLEGTPGLALVREIRPEVKAISWMYCLLVEDESRRDKLMRYLDEKGIQTRTLFIPMHQQPMFKVPGGDARYPVAADISRRGLYLPSGSGLTEEQIHYICDCIKVYVKWK